MEEKQRTLIVRVQTHDAFMEEARQKAEAIHRGEGYQGEVRSFTDFALMFRVFSEKRITLINKLKEIGPSTLRGLARSLHRDVKRVHEDANLLLEEKVIERDPDGLLFVPFEVIRIEAVFADNANSAAA